MKILLNNDLKLTMSFLNEADYWGIADLLDVWYWAARETCAVSYMGSRNKAISKCSSSNRVRVECHD